jgi:ribosome-associated protein
MLFVPIHTETIKLDQFLKLADVAAGGGEAKIRIQNGDVTVNGEVERRRGRKLHAGDLVSVDGKKITVTSG